MKTNLLFLSAMLLFSLNGHAALFPSGTLGGTAIPDNNSIGTDNNLGYTLSGANSVITDIALSFTLQGGYEGDLTGYLRLGNTLTSPAYNLTTLIQSQTLNELTPTIYTISFTTPGFQSVFDGLNPNGNWRLFFADGTPGDQTTVNSWSLDVTAVPEPANVALGIFLGLAGLGKFCRWWVQRRATAAR